MALKFGHDAAKEPGVKLYEVDLDGRKSYGYAIDPPEAIRLARLADGASHVRAQNARTIDRLPEGEDSDIPAIRAAAGGESSVAAVPAVGDEAKADADARKALSEREAQIDSALDKTSDLQPSEAQARASEPLPGITPKMEESLEDMPGDNKQSEADAIRDAIKAAPKASNKDIAADLARKGVNVSSSQITAIRKKSSKSTTSRKK